MSVYFNLFVMFQKQESLLQRTDEASGDRRHFLFYFKLRRLNW